MIVVDFFNLTGPEFLLVFIPCAVVALVVGVILRACTLGPFVRPAAGWADLDGYEYATIRGGAVRAVEAAVMALVVRDLVTVNADGLIVRTEPPRGVDTPIARLHPFERAVYAATPERDGVTMTTLFPMLDAEVTAIGERLTSAGYFPSQQQNVRSLCIAASPVVLVLLVGAIKCVIGLQGGYPLLFLVIVLIVLVIVATFVLLRFSRTGRGSMALRGERSSQVALRMSVASEPGRVAPRDLAMALGLFGLGILATTPYAAMAKSMGALRGTSGDAMSSSSGCSTFSTCGGGGGSCGGGDGGGSDGGGGGCGGCGGD